MEDELIYYNNNGLPHEKTCLRYRINKLQINVYIFDLYLVNFTTERRQLQCMHQCDFQVQS